MVTREEIEELGRYRNPDYPVISFYINIDKQRPDENKYQIRLKNLLQEIGEQREKYTREQWESVESDVEKIRSYVREAARQSARSVAAFACSAGDFWRTFTFSQRVANLVQLNDQPMLKPLMRLLEDYKPYCVIMVDKSKARLFLIEFDQIIDRSDIFSDVPKHHEQGGWEQSKIQRAHEEAVAQHLKTVADQAFALFQDTPFSKLLVGGREETVQEFEQYLHPYLKECVIATFPISMTAKPKTILEKALGVLAEVEAKESWQLAQELENQVKSRGEGVAGLEPTLQALQQGQVMKLLVEEGYQAPGGRCTQCGSLIARQDVTCPYCQGKVQRLDDVVEAAIEQAMAQDAEVHFLDSAAGEQLKKLGNIGAVLRYRITSESAGAGG